MSESIAFRQQVCPVFAPGLCDPFMALFVAQANTMNRAGQSQLARALRNMPGAPEAEAILPDTRLSRSRSNALLPAVVFMAAVLTGTPAALAQKRLPERAPLPPERPAAVTPADQPRGLPAHRPEARERPGEKPAQKSEEPLQPPERPNPIAAPGPIAPLRPAIRACIAEWRDLQKAGATSGTLWRDFSGACIARHMGTRNAPPAR